MRKLRQIRKEGFSKVMTVTGIFPEDWRFVQAEIVSLLDKKKHEIVVKFVKAS